ncbi:S-adenosyl-l-methionine hydroxide adenosyltransferase [Halalkaliarchaeum sp. AArc-CO]|uniref:SAM hydrolase/SAM-dependent halogenase family protein n=1 Tax=unclassified Halalkaliarchaeum TaxID=2678344 RepID=UPI00217EFA0E|nr:MULTISPECIES: SAM-dependent chlorinase/fluorinase [unclassified Halalkaliarchaeum]MDR5672375.1 SAM-dependent chlorinase/fluorinase [Halalkaliarchaeum sp. AArc-GB]UWG49995.1 S-adenosyl-l-methionine hydroxide adenosyltransferase [Halalkaliarchaeum sp. AArc-CO]
MITLSSDFGSPYPAAMKGVLLRRTDARIVDVAHDLPRQDVRAAGFWLRFVLPEFPPGVHCAVVDPGVGTDRDAIVIRAGDHALVGPDNGSLVPAARAFVDEGSPGRGSSGDESGGDSGGDRFEVFVYRPDDPASSTFHGRDVFAPLAADVHEAGISSIEDIDGVEPTGSFVDLRFPEPVPIDDPEAVGRDVDTVDGIAGEVLVVDGFGNAITNVPGAVAEGHDRAAVNGTWLPVVDTFADVDPGDRLLTVGSHGYLECDVREGRGDEAFDLEPGDRVVFGFPTAADGSGDVSERLRNG